MIRNGAAAVGLLALLVWAANFFLVDSPIRDALKGDSRNENYTLVAHYRYYVDPSTLVLDLRGADGAAPVDLFRGLFQSARTMHEAERSFERVILARAHSTVFVMNGDAFYDMGASVEAGENPVYLIRTLPEKLFNPDGTQAYGTWTGGLLGVVTRQMDDANEAARRWAGGH